VDALADAFVAEWYAMYPAAMGIAGNGPITTDMLQLYNGWYRSASTPMVIGEHCLGADAGGIRPDRPTPQAAADAVFAVMAKHFNFTNSPQPPAPPQPAVLHLNGHVVGGGFKDFWEANPFNMQAYGLPLSEEIAARIVEPDGRAHTNTVQFFERAIFVYDPAAASGWTVTTATLGQLVEEVR
jgi:hypothetical protein